MDTVLITGGSAGIGLELSKQFAQNGFRILIVSLKDDEINTAIDQLKKEYSGLEVHGLAKDLTDRNASQEVYDWTVSNGWTVDVLCNNAGIGLFGDFTQISESLQLKLIDLNVVGTFQMTKRFLPGMIERDKGKIMMLSSVTINQANPPHCVYGATKSFIDHFSRSLYYDLKVWKNSNVTVTSVIPPAVKNTNFQQTQGVDMKTFKEGVATSTPEEVAKDAYKGTMAGKKRVYCGQKHRILRMLGLPLVPEGLLMPLVKKELQPVEGTKIDYSKK